jgi:hypothetical protein
MYDLIICVYACYTVEKYKNQIEVINSTWGPQCKLFNIKLVYFLGEENRIGFEDNEFTSYINLVGVHNDYLSASYKQFLGLKYIYENYATQFIICIGTDTYLNIPKLISYIHTFECTDCLYIGGHGCNRQIGLTNYYFHSGGPGFIITYPVLQKIYTFLPNLMDHWIQLCKENNIHNLIPACDVAISYYLQQPNINVNIIKNESFLNCNYKGFPCHPNLNMSTIISCHLMSTIDFYNFTTILKLTNYFL